MRQRLQKIPALSAFRTTLFKSLVVVLCAVVLPAFSLARRKPAHTAVEPSKNAEPAGTRSSTVRAGVIDTNDGLLLRLTTDLGSVKILQLESGTSSVLRYTVHIETDARGPAAQQLLDSYALKAKSTSYGVEIVGTLPQQIARSTDAQFWVQFEVTVPRGTASK